MENNGISFCTVTFNNEKKIKNFILNLENVIDSTDQIYIVDNRSSDETINIIKEMQLKFKNINLIIAGNNNGFGSGNNKVIKDLTSRYHVVINPDVSINSIETLSNMKRYMDNNPNVGLLSPKLKGSDGKVQKLYKSNPTVFDLMIRFISPNLFKKRQSNFVHANLSYTEIGHIDYASGACMFFRTEIFKKIRGFDERYFMYMEDADITREVNKISESIFFPNVDITHEWQRQSHKKIKFMLITIISMVKYFDKCGWKFA